MLQAISIKRILLALSFIGLVMFMLYFIEAKFHILYPLDLIILKPDYEIHSIDYQLYKLAIEKRKPGNYEVTSTWKRNKFMIDNEAGFYKIEDRLDTILRYIVYSVKEFPGIEVETAENFFNSNRNPRLLLQENFASGLFQVLPKEEIWGLSGRSTKSYNEEVNRIASGSFGHLGFSKIGFNRKKTQAIFTMGYSDGPLSGEGTMFIFSLKEDVWILEKTINLWVS